MAFWNRKKKPDPQNVAETAYTTSELMQLQTKCNDWSLTGSLKDNDLVNVCVNNISIHTSKASAKVIRRTSDGIKVDDADNLRLERLLNLKPNPYMNARDFLMKCRSLCEINGTVFIYVDKDAGGKVSGFYPVFYGGVEALVKGDHMKSLLGFRFNIGSKYYDFDLADLAVIRRTYTKDNYFGDGIQSLYNSVKMQQITDRGLENAIKLTSNVMGILKHPVGNLNNKDLMKSRDDFVKNYVDMINSGGIAAIDSKMEFIPVKLTPTTANMAQMQMYNERVMMHFGTNKDILMNSHNEDQWSAFYEGQIEPFLISLSQEFTRTCFTERELGFGNEIIYESNKLQYASNRTKLSLSALVDRGVLSLNQYLEILNLPPVEGGDVRVIRKEYTQVEDMGGEDDGV